MKKKFSFFSSFFKSFANYRAFYKRSSDERNIVFYSESGQDWHHFKRIVETLLARQKNVCYVTSDRHDAGLSLKHSGYHAFYMQEGFWQILFFQFLKADCLILTMIDLHLFQLKRSINPVHYIYLFHAMGSTHMVDFENSYDHYDTILCVGPHQIAEIRARERLKNLPEKQCIPHGYARVEELMQHAGANRRNPVQPYSILVAPTWGENSILPVCGKQLVSILLTAGYRVTLRPHYQTRKLTPGIIDDVLATYGNHARFSCVEKMGDTTSLFDSDLLICDWSSTSIEYALGLEKPVLYIDVPRRVRNPHYEELGLEPLEAGIREEVGKVIAPNELEKAPAIIDELLAQPEAFGKKVAEIRERVLFNIGKSVETGAEAIVGVADAMRERRGGK
jgi:hypothetical protein